MELLPEIVQILSEDSYLIKNRLKFVHALRISEAKVASWVKLHDMGHCQPYDLIHGILSEWIAKREDSATIAELRRILRGIDFNLCSNNLSHLEKMHPGPIGNKGLKTSSGFDAIASPHASRPPTKTSFIFGVKDFVLNFVGRDEELTTLNEYFHSPETCRSVLLSGLGGIGKTELAKKFIVNISNFKNSQIVKSWLAGESSETLLNSTTQLCHHLSVSATGSNGQPLGMQEMLQNIFTRLQSSTEYSRWLVVIDNVNEIHQEFQTALDTLSDFGSYVFLVVISRRRDISTGEFLELTELKLEDSVKFLKNSLKTDKSSEDVILALCRQLNNFPLVMNHSVAYIKQQQRQARMTYGVQNYLDELASIQTLDTENNDTTTEGYPKAIFKVWHLTLNKIEESHGTDGRVALNLLNIMAFIAPDNIQTTFLRKLYKRFYPLEQIELNQIHSSCLPILLQYSLISSINNRISVHQLLQLALQTKMSSMPNQDNLTRDAEMLKSFWTSFSSKQWNRDEMANILKIWKHSSTHPELHEQVAVKSIHLSQELSNLGMVKELYDFATDCCKFLLAIHGPDNKEYLMMEHRLAAVMQQKGLYESSLQKFTFVYGKRMEVCGEDDPDTLAAGLWIASVFLYLHRFKESLEWGQKVLQSSIKIHGEKNEITMDTKHNVALALRSLGKGEEALKMYNEILGWKEVHLGKHHLSTLATRDNIGICFNDVGKYAEALDIFQDVLSLRQQHSGVDHPRNLITKHWLADTLEKMGEIDKALDIMEEVAVTRENVLGPDHPHTELTHNQTSLLKNKGKQ